MSSYSIAATVCLLVASIAPAQQRTPYVRDIDFLLNEFESQAGYLLKQKGIDWDAVRAEFTAQALSTNTDEEQYRLILRLISRLQDGHASIVESNIKSPYEVKGYRRTGPRVHLAVSEGKVIVRAAFKDAAEAGLHAGQEVVTIDRTPVHDWLADRVLTMQERGSGFSTPHQALYAACHWGLADWEGTPILFEIKDKYGAIKTIKRICDGGPNYVPFGPVFPPANLKFIERQSFGHTPESFGYVHLRNIPGTLPEQIDKMLEALEPMPGLILDMRANGGGGCDHEAVFGRFLAKDTWLGRHRGVVEHPFVGPMVVIIDAGVRSAGETVVGMLKEDGRAYVIGDSPTAGTSSQKTELITPSGQFRVRFSVRTNGARFNQGRGIEGIGIRPHELVPINPQDLEKDQDSLIKRAVELLQQGFPQGVVRYQDP